jgi:Asp-tRNA(Asn)/Glu-tRNA(Gln) amidotransferase A subunit family amidase
LDFVSGLASWRNHPLIVRTLRFGSILVAAVCLARYPAQAQPVAAFRVEETSIAQIHEAIRAHRVTARQVVQQYLARIDAYDKQGPRLNALITVNADALAAADVLDVSFARSGRLVGPLHGIPVIVKDNLDTADMPTSGGSLMLAKSRPPDDAFVVRRLRDAGAIILAKANLAEFASSAYETVSSALAGYTRNPYDLGRTTAGSSGGTAAAVAANFGAVGIGTDTGNSIRGPSSHQALVGLRSTVGLVSGDGLIPLDPSRDVTGPMTRTVTDAAIVMDAIAGVDLADPMSARGRGHLPTDGYVSALKPDGLRGTRIGVLRQLSNTPTTDSEILTLFEAALAVMRDKGAVLVDPAIIPDADTLAQRTPVECRPFRQALGAYLATLGERAPVRSLAQILASGQFHPSMEFRLHLYQDAQNPDENPACRAADRQVADLHAQVRTLLSGQRLDALVYPSWNNPPRLVGDLNTPHGSNGPRIASVIGVPAITVPMGWMWRATLPAGLEILGDEWSELRLIQIAYGYEQATTHRRPPVTAPPLNRE